ncbi:hypothetical protein DFH29DRAFT_532838 [Suillus ampliporus]|nr:hypothetical protein DFH29DRAFT_532838 [Suillus ampliporus]
MFPLYLHRHLGCTFATYVVLLELGLRSALAYLCGERAKRVTPMGNLVLRLVQDLTLKVSGGSPVEDPAKRARTFLVKFNAAQLSTFLRVSSL